MTFLQSRYNFQINLSPKELLEISEEISRRFAPGFSTAMPDSAPALKLSQREMLDISEAISREFAPHALTDTPELTLLPIDPHHLYAYWNLGENDAKALGDEAGQQLTLRIYSEPDSRAETVAEAPRADGKGSQDAPIPFWIDIDIRSPRAQQTVSLPAHVDETAYSAVIGKRNQKDNSLIAATYSNIIHVPRGGISACQDQHEQPVRDAPPGAEIGGCLRKSASGQGNLYSPQ